MQGKYKVYIRNMEQPLAQVIRKGLSALRGLSSFIETYKGKVKKAYVVTTGRMPEKLTDTITAIPWQFL
jgi:hypothetical protein